MRVGSLGSPEGPGGVLCEVWQLAGGQWVSPVDPTVKILKICNVLYCTVIKGLLLSSRISIYTVPYAVRVWNFFRGGKFP